MIRIVGQIGIAVLVAGMLSCSSQSPAPIAKASPTPAKPALPKDENGNDLQMPEIVHARQVRIESGDVKSVIVGNDNGEYSLFCNTKAGNCLTPVPAKDYYVFNSNTKWKMPGAKDYITLKWVQDWTVSYPKTENIALVPAEGGGPDELGMYGLSSWKAADKK
ncbi:MAG TPA: hypothetical protein VGQ12_08615 [Candidatus Angelobacter sp.]|jgi:hypothetical protein|nr:hypothetical protein [Candidatus Angelobacter sp.]